MNTRAKKQSAEWEVKKDLDVLKGDIEILEKLANGKFKDYDGKAVNGWLEKRMKNATDDVYLKQDEYYKGMQYTITSHKSYRWNTAHGWDYSPSNIHIMIECTDENNFIYDEFEKQIQNAITRKKERVAELEAIDFDDLFERYEKLYNDILKFKEESPSLDAFNAIRNFY